MKDNKKETLYQFIKFGLVGLSNTVLSYVVYCVLVKLNTHYQIANIVGFIVGVLNSYYWNNRYVFKTNEGEKRNHIKTLFKTFVAYGITGLLLQGFLLWLFVERFEIDSLIAQLLGLCITVPLNFVLNKFWSFKIN